jgi:hypothetical protein
MSMVGGSPRVKNGHIMKPSDNGDGYGQVGLSDDDGQKFLLVHRLVMLAFVGEDPGKPVVNHMNGITTDNRLENLEWVTHSRNCQHAVENGLRNNLGRAKLTYEDVAEIWRRILLGDSDKSIAADFGVTPGNISHIRHGRTWKGSYRADGCKTFHHRPVHAKKRFQVAKIHESNVKLLNRALTTTERIAA